MDRLTEMLSKTVMQIQSRQDMFRKMTQFRSRSHGSGFCFVHPTKNRERETRLIVFFLEFMTAIMQSFVSA